MARITVQSLSDRIDAQDVVLAAILAAVTGRTPAAVVPAPEPVVTFPAAMRAKRLERRAANPLGGLTSVERKAIAATLPKGYSREQWTAAVAAYKAS